MALTDTASRIKHQTNNDINEWLASIYFFFDKSLASIYTQRKERTAEIHNPLPQPKIGTFFFSYNNNIQETNLILQMLSLDLSCENTVQLMHEL